MTHTSATLETAGSADESLLADITAVFERRPDALANPYPVYRRLRDEAPVLRVGPLVVVSRYADVQTVLRAPDLFSSVRGTGSRIASRKAQLDAEGGRKLQELIDHEHTWLVQMDRPDHTRVRALANQAFTPRRIAAMRDRVQAIMDELLEPADARGSIELVSEVSQPLPLRVIVEMLGASPDRAQDIRRWSDEIGLMIGTDYSNVDSAYEALQSFRSFAAELIEELRGKGDATDLFAAMVSAEEGGERLSTDELVGMCVLLLFAGHETTTNLISNSVLSLLRHPEQLQVLREDPSLTFKAVEEFLRYSTSVHAIHRVAKEDTEIGGVAVRAGDSVRLMLASANHDPRAFDDPERFDVRRPNAAKHLGLGFGIHTCLGAWVARLETDVAVTSLITRYPGLRLDGEVEQSPNFTLYGPRRVPLALR
jgi:cytochrome P450